MAEWTQYEECLAKELAEEATGCNWDRFSLARKKVWIRAWRYIRDEWGMRMREADAIIADAAKKNTEEESDV